MTEATIASSKKIIGAPCKLYKLTSVSNTNTLTTDFGTVSAAFITTYDSLVTGTPTYASYTVSNGTLTIYVPIECSMDVLVWGR